MEKVDTSQKARTNLNEVHDLKNFDYFRLERGKCVALDFIRLRKCSKVVAVYDDEGASSPARASTGRRSRRRRRGSGHRSFLAACEPWSVADSDMDSTEEEDLNWSWGEFST